MATENEMIGWHHCLSRHECEQTPGDSEGQVSLACYSPWSCKESDTTERLHFHLSFTTDWFDLLAVQGTLKSLLQHHDSEASILWHSAFFMVQLPHPYMTTALVRAVLRLID